MPLFFNKMQRHNPQDPEGERKWYVVLRSTGIADEQEMAKLLSEETTLNPKEAEMAIYQLFKVVVRQLLNSKTVPLGSIGTLRLTVSSEGADTEKEANANLIKELNVRLVPSEEFKQELKKAEFIYVKDMLPDNQQEASSGQA